MNERLWDLSYVERPDGRFMTLFIAGEGEAPTQEHGPYPAREAGTLIRDALVAAGLYSEPQAAAYAYIGRHFRHMEAGKNLSGADYPSKG